MRNQAFLFSQQPSLEASFDSWLTGAKDEAFRLINCPLRVGQRQEVLNVHMFIHSLRSLFHLPTRSCVWLFPLPPTLPRFLFCHWGEEHYLLVFWTAAWNSSLRLTVKEKHPESGHFAVFSSYWVMVKEHRMYKQFHCQRVHTGVIETRGWNGLSHTRVWAWGELGSLVLL